MDSHTDRQHVSEVDRVGEPTHEVLVHSQDGIWIVRSATTGWNREMLLDVVVARETVIKVVKIMCRWEFITSC